ncbi:hypothetical protein [Pseudomonas jessenii]|uniref:hypothetical protein n=1 Tax=Pseudomonas jessenii TaxID=77298 RepID=UPI00389208BA
MNWIKPLTHSALAATLFAAAMTHAGDQKVTAIPADSIDIYTQKNDYFVIEQQITRNALTLPTPVLAQSAKGYVKVSQQGKEMWFDEMDVILQPPNKLAAGCVPTTDGTTSFTSAGVRGTPDC